MLVRRRGMTRVEVAGRTVDRRSKKSQRPASLVPSRGTNLGETGEVASHGFLVTLGNRGRIIVVDGTANEVGRWPKAKITSIGVQDLQWLEVANGNFQRYWD